MDSAYFALTSLFKLLGYMTVPKCSIVAPNKPLFLRRLHHDIRFKVYREIVLSGPVRIYNILEPHTNDPHPLTALYNSNNEIRNEMNDWYAQNTSSLTRKNGEIFINPTVDNTKYYLKWTSDSWGGPSIGWKALETWWRFLYQDITPPVGHLIIDWDHEIKFDLSLSYAKRLRHYDQAAGEALWYTLAAPYNLQGNRKGLQDLPIAASLSKVELILNCKDDSSWDEVLDWSWHTLWPRIAGELAMPQLRSKLNIPDPDILTKFFRGREILERYFRASGTSGLRSFWDKPDPSNAVGVASRAWLKHYLPHTSIPTCDYIQRRHWTDSVDTLCLAAFWRFYDLKRLVERNHRFLVTAFNLV